VVSIMFALAIAAEIATPPRRLALVKLTAYFQGVLSTPFS
jgi:hypothetical protein